MRKPTILLMNRVYPPMRGATGRILRDMARSFARDGWQVTVITSGMKACTERDGAVKVIRVKGAEKPANAIGYTVVWVKMMIAALKLPASDLVVTMTDPPLFVVAGDIVCRIKKSKHMHWVQDVYPDLFPVVGTWFPRFVLDLMDKVSVGAMERTDKVIVIGRCMARRLSYSGVSPRNMTVIPNWPDLELRQETIEGPFDEARVHDDDFETVIAASGRAENYRTHQEQIKTGPKFRVLYAGNIGKAHPVQVVLDAARILQNKNPEIEFLFVGDGPKYDEITRAKAQEHLDNVKLLPYQPPARLRSLMESGDVHLVSLDPHAAGLCVPSKVYAALAAHRPCIYIGPDGTETAKLIEDYKFGLMIEPNKPEDLADAIRGYRMDGEAWYSAHQNAQKAAAVFVPKASIHAFIERAWAIVGGKPDESAVERIDDLAAE